MYSLHSTFQFWALDVTTKKCNIKVQLPAGIEETPGTPLSVAKVAIIPLVFAPSVIEAVCVVVDVGVGDNCLYVGLPKAELVFKDKFIQYI